MKGYLTKMDKTLIDIISICLGWVGLYGAIKKSSLDEFKSVYGVNLKKYKNQVVDDFKNNISILLTIIVFLGLIVAKIFDDKISDRIFDFSTYIVISAIMIGISIILYMSITKISKVLARRKYFNEIKSKLIKIASQVQSLLQEKREYEQIEKLIIFLEDILDIVIKDNDFEIRFNKIKTVLYD